MLIPRKKTQNRGFTLIELLIVVAIIAILSTLLMVNFIAVRQRGRDAERKADLRQIQTALELYRADQDAYPDLLDTCTGSLGFPPNCDTIYMKKIPLDPSYPNYWNDGNYYYKKDTSGTYVLYACIENTNDKDTNIVILATPPDGSTQTCLTNEYYELTSP